jgi:hypothetical protein
MTAASMTHNHTVTRQTRHTRHTSQGHGSHRSEEGLPVLLGAAHDSGVNDTVELHGQLVGVLEHSCRQVKEKVRGRGKRRTTALTTRKKEGRRERGRRKRRKQANTKGSKRKKERKKKTQTRVVGLNAGDELGVLVLDRVDRVLLQSGISTRKEEEKKKRERDRHRQPRQRAIARSGSDRRSLTRQPHCNSTGKASPCQPPATTQGQRQR